jgi:hypothetical protein
LSAIYWCPRTVPAWLMAVRSHTDLRSGTRDSCRTFPSTATTLDRVPARRESFLDQRYAQTAASRASPFETAEQRHHRGRVGH